MKRILSLILGLTAIAATAIETNSGRLSDNITWTLQDSVLTIHGQDKMPSYTPTSFTKLPWQDEKFAAKVARIVVEEGITDVGDYFFASRQHIHNVRDTKGKTFYATQGAESSELFCNIKEVILPATIEKIGHHAFARMPLSHIAIPEAVKEIRAGAFANTDLRCVILPAGIRKIGPEAFLGCQNLRAVDFNNAAIKLSTGLFFDDAKLRMLMHTAQIKDLQPSTFNSTAFEQFKDEALLDMFATDGAQYYLDTMLPKGNKDPELEKAVLDIFYEKEAKNATSLFLLDRFMLEPYNADTHAFVISTVHNGNFVLPVPVDKAAAFVANWPEIRGKAQPAYRPVNGKVELQNVTYQLGDNTYVAAKL